MAKKALKSGIKVLPIVAIVGRPNVGKSTLFNRLIGKRLAITSEVAGTTRDRIYHHVSFKSLSAILVDTGGMEYGRKENIEADVQAQVNIAIEEADLIFFVVDSKEGLTINDMEAASKLRKSHKMVVFIANKADTKSSEENVGEILRLGFGEPIKISAYHNTHVEQLIDIVEKKLKQQGWGKRREMGEQQKLLNLCFLGKPNVGKSSLVNALLGKPKVIVSEIPGTTRDSTDTEIEWQGKKMNLIDTAGLRRRGRIEKGLEKISSFRSLQAIERSDIVCLILDYGEGIRKQDQHIASYIMEASKGLILVVNKCDLMEDRTRDETRTIHLLRSRFEFLPWAPAVFVSALKKSNLEKILEIAEQIKEERSKEIDRDELHGFMKETIYKNMPPKTANRRPSFYRLEQTNTNPPTFTYWVNDPTVIHFSYRRYLENEFRKKYPFTGTSIKFIFKKKVKR